MCILNLCSYYKFGHNFYLGVGDSTWCFFVETFVTAGTQPKNKIGMETLLLLLCLQTKQGLTRNSRAAVSSEIEKGGNHSDFGKTVCLVDLSLFSLVCLSALFFFFHQWFFSSPTRQMQIKNLFFSFDC